MTRLPPYMIRLCRELRQKSTTAEELLWQCLRRKQLGGLKFRRQHPIGRYIADFCCTEATLIVEIDGSVHTEIQQSRYDEVRDRELELNGNRVVRLRNDEVLMQPEQALAMIIAAISPLPVRERGQGRG